jgi:hypothetical protein
MSERAEPSDGGEYEAPAVESRTSTRDPLVWVTVSSPVCL